MRNVIPPLPYVSARIAEGPLFPYVDAFKHHLFDRGYTSAYIASCIGCTAHFAQWFYRQHLPIRGIEEAVVAEFLDKQLPALATRAGIDSICVPR